jgi:hypothetical protein
MAALQPLALFTDLFPTSFFFAFFTFFFSTSFFSALSTSLFFISFFFPLLACFRAWAILFLLLFLNLKLSGVLFSSASYTQPSANRPLSGVLSYFMHYTAQ